MKKLGTIIGWMVELAIPVGLLWQCLKLYNLGWYDIQIVAILLPITPIFAIAHWQRLKRKRYHKNIRRKLFFLTGPSIILSFLLISLLAREINLATIKGYHPKEFATEVAKKTKGNLLVKKDTLEGRLIAGKYPQSDVIYYLRFERQKSELLIYVMLLLSSCILYKTRSSSSRSPTMETTEPEKGKENTS